MYFSFGGMLAMELVEKGILLGSGRRGCDFPKFALVLTIVLSIGLYVWRRAESMKRGKRVVHGGWERQWAVALSH